MAACVCSEDGLFGHHQVRCNGLRCIPISKSSSEFDAIFVPWTLPPKLPSRIEEHEHPDQTTKIEERIPGSYKSSTSSRMLSITCSTAFLARCSRSATESIRRLPPRTTLIASFSTTTKRPDSDLARRSIPLSHQSSKMVTSTSSGQLNFKPSVRWPPPD